MIQGMMTILTRMIRGTMTIPVMIMAGITKNDSENCKDDEH